MEKDEILVLLEKYWKAETTIQEEKAIKQFFAEHDITDVPETEAQWFVAFHEFQNIKHGVVDVKKQVGEQPAKVLDISFLMKVAAILIAGTFLTIWGISYNHNLQEIRNKDMQQKAEASLMAISQALNQGYNSIDQSAGDMLNIKPSN
jgi:hypothetical protein